MADITVVNSPVACINHGTDIFISQRDLSLWLAKSELASSHEIARSTLAVVREGIEALGKNK